MTDYTDMGEALDWDDEVSDEGGFALLPAGTYPFEVIKVEKERYEGGDKVAACPRAAVTLNILTNDGWVPVVDRLLLNTKMAWKIAKFFEALGYVKNPETGKVPMRWNEAEGKQGWVKLKVRKYKKDGTEREANDVDAYLKPDEWPEQGTPVAASAPAYAAAPAPAAVPAVQQPAYQQKLYSFHTQACLADIESFCLSCSADSSERIDMQHLEC